MYRVIDNRCAGKTGRLMLIAKETNATFVCANPRGMKQKAHAYGITGIDFISYEEAIDHMRNFDSRYTADSRKQNIVIDELEVFAQMCLGMNGTLVGYTLSNED